MSFFFKRKIFWIIVVLLFCSILLSLLPENRTDVNSKNLVNNTMGKRRKFHNFKTMIDQAKESLILVWKYGQLLENRHIRQYHPTKRFSPWENCSVQCILTYDSKLLEYADAIVFPLFKMSKNDAKEISQLSKEKKRDPNQAWIFLTDESPMHTIFWPEYRNLFNWSMTYRSDSDIPVPYGRTIPKKYSNPNQDAEILKNVYKNIKEKNKLVSIMGSNCSKGKFSGSNRWNYVNSLSKCLKEKSGNKTLLDIFGKCLGGNLTACPGHFDTDCPFLNSYKFYLAFENSNCAEYITEKVFWNAYSKFSVPIIMGPPKKDCERLLPQNSFIHVQDFSSPSSLADYLMHLNNNEEKYKKFHHWRLQFDVINEHGYFGTPSKHYCRLCEAVKSKNKKKKIYSNPENFWSKKDCIIDDKDYEFF